MDISKIDKNFTTQSVEGEEYKMYEPSKLCLEGFPWQETNSRLYHRLPDNIISTLSAGIAELRQCSSGGVIRFKTNSRAILLKGRYIPFNLMRHMPLTGQGGFDVVLRKNGENRLIANLYGAVDEIIDKKFDFSLSCKLSGEMEEYWIYMPLYAGVESLEIGLCDDAEVEVPTPHKISKPVLFYGSSITQGACASRPSNCHSALLSSIVDAEQINLGFAGCAKGEASVAEAIAELDLSCFVMDYDYNAPNSQHLKDTHEPFFKIIREKHPNLPVVLISRPHASPDFELAESNRDIIMQTYLNARSSGDENVYFVDGIKFFENFPREMPTVYRCHPTDLGFYLMTNNIAPVLKQALGI